MGYKEKLLRDQEYIISLAYNTAAFNNSKKKPKALKYYIQKLRNAARTKTTDKKPVDVEKSKQIEETIERLKKRR